MSKHLALAALLLTACGPVTVSLPDTGADVPAEAARDAPAVEAAQAAAPREDAADVRSDAACPDRDNDGHGAMPCGGDCDDTNARVHPGQPAACGPTLRSGAYVDINCNDMGDFVEPSRAERCAGEMNAAMRMAHPTQPNPDRAATCLFPRGGANAQVCVSCWGTGALERCACWQSVGDPIAPYRCDSSGFRL